MLAYLIRRLLLIIPTLLLITLIVFFLVRFIPGSMVDLIVAEMQNYAIPSVDITIDPEYIRHSLGLDVPAHIQYCRWLGILPNAEGSFSGIFQGDLGNSMWTLKPVLQQLAERVPVSFELGIIGVVIGLAAAIPIGVYSAIRQDTLGDYVGRTVSIVCLSLPSFWVGTMVIVYPSIWWGWMPSVEYVSPFKSPMGNLLMFVVPAAILGMHMSGTTMRMTRTMMLEVLRQDYIRTAWSKGLTERAVILRHAMKNALIPVVTLVGMLLPITISGAVILETIFNLPGVGKLLIEAINTRDYTVISGINLVLATFVLFINLVVDLSYAYLDPRVNYK